MMQHVVYFAVVIVLTANGCSRDKELRPESQEEPSAETSFTGPEVTRPRRLSASSAAQEEAQRGLARVNDPSQVCMVNDRFMGSAQIPVEVAGRTYFGCCEACEGRLREESGVRAAIDPQSKRAVDKAGAVIAKDARGGVYYFESEANLSAFNGLNSAN